MWQGRLNQEQLSALSDLSFDLAKGAFAIALLPSFSLSDDVTIKILNIIIGIIVGLAFTWYGLLLLRLKGRKP